MPAKTPATPAVVPIYLTTAQLASMLSISVRTAEDWRRSKNAGPPWCKVGKLCRYRLSEVEVYLKQNTVTPGK